MKVIDITGVIREGMWNYDKPFPQFKLKPLGKVPWVENEVFCEIFEGMHSQTGTYLETPAHFYGNDKCYLVSDVPVGKLYEIPCTILKIDKSVCENPLSRIEITVDMLKSCPAANEIREGGAILVATGWDKYWMDEKFLEESPYFTYEAMKWLISKKPFLMGTDFPRWDNLQKPQGFFEEFYAADILMLAPCINLINIEKNSAKLTVLPMNIPGTSSVPCRAVIVHE